MTLDFDTILIKRFLRDEYKSFSIWSIFEATIDNNKIKSSVKSIDKENLIIELENWVKIRFQ